MKYWKADKATSKQILALLEDWEKVMKSAKRVARSIGANPNCVYTCNGFTRKYVSGFTFKDESKIDKKKFVRLKGTDDGWRPRAGTPLSKTVQDLSSCCVGDIMDLIGMPLFSGGLSVSTPGIDSLCGTVYLTVPDNVAPIGCKRISDVEFEKAIQKGETE